jgi:hypothetical protein
MTDTGQVVQSEAALYAEEEADDLPTNNVESETFDRPRICLIDLEQDVAAELKQRGYNCYTGTLGSIVEVNNVSQSSTRRCRINYDFPPNLHEYDIVLVDLQNETRVPYAADEHKRIEVKGYTDILLLSVYPQMLFDPRPLAANILRDKLKPLLQKDSILVVFGAEQERQEYHPLFITAREEKVRNLETHFLYDFFPNLPHSVNKTGSDTRVTTSAPSELSSLLARHNKSFRYHIVFQHPTYWESNSNPRALDRNFLPLVEAQPGEVVSFLYLNEGNLSFLFPHVDKKLDFLTELLERVLPEVRPTLFPFNTRFAWLSNPSYALPNQDSYNAEMAQLESEYEAKRVLLSEQMELNRQKYAFLHDLLKQTGDALVKTVEYFLRWLGFEKVENVDESNPALMEEDLRIETARGLLVVEVKGIGGTSTDNDCSQINKIRFRRMKERNSFDVFSLYVVNHQRYLPPRSRSNPPFNQNQISHAISDERGLLTTYELFNLYFNISAEYVSKEDARDQFYTSGLVQFPPTGATKFSGDFEIHHKGRVVILDVEGFELNIGDIIILENSGRYSSAEVLEIRKYDESVSSASSGEIGIQLSEAVTKDTRIWFSIKADA